MEKYTVIVPTRNRADTLGPTLKTCLRQTYPNYEIIVSDNMSEDNTKDVVASMGDSRIRYINPGRRLSMSGNFEFALHHVNEGFMMFIGADDGLMPEAIDYVDQLVQQYKVLAVSCQQATYGWPNFPDPALAGRFHLAFLRRDVEIRRADEWIKRALRFETAYCFDLPNIYCGFIHKSVVNRAIVDGTYFRSRTPDAYGAFASAIFLDHYAYSHKPFVIAGASVGSTGWSQLHKVGSNAESERFEQENDIELAEGFVSCPSFQVILGEAFTKVAEKFKEQCSSYTLDFEAMLGYSLQDSNKRTKDNVQKAAQKMALRFGVDLEKARRLPRPKAANSARKKRKILRIWQKMRRHVYPSLDADTVDVIIATKALGAMNIDEAILVSQILAKAGSNSINQSIWPSNANLLEIIEKLRM